MDSIQEMESWMNKKLKVKTSDKREFVGTLVCIDHWSNLLMQETKQFTFTDKMTDEKYLGLVMVPGKDIEQVWTQSV